MASPKITVVQTLPALNVGGVERGTVDVAVELVRRGHRAIVISKGGRLVQELTAAGVEHILLEIGEKSLFTLRHVKPLRKLFHATRADIIHARSRLPAWITYLAWKGMGLEARPRFITSVHGPYTVNAYSGIMVRGERVIAISEFIKDYILYNYPKADPAKIVVIPRGVDAGKYIYGYRPETEWLDRWRSEHPQIQNKFLVTLPARITRWKGQEDFLKIIHLLKTRGESVHGIIAGGAENKQFGFLEKLKRLSAKLGITNDVTFLGHRDDLREIMSVSDLVLSLAREPEAFGRTALEALSLGIPVIAYDHGGASEVLGAMFPEGRVPPWDFEAAAGLIYKFRQSPPVVPEGNPYTLEKMLDKTIALYESCCKSGHGR